MPQSKPGHITTGKTVTSPDSGVWYVTHCGYLMSEAERKRDRKSPSKKVCDVCRRQYDVLMSRAPGIVMDEADSFAGTTRHVSAQDSWAVNVIRQGRKYV